jgi:hypothetical protein
VPDGLGFHEATILGMSRTEDAIVVALDGVRTADGPRRCEAVFHGVRSVEADGAPYDDLRMEAEDGELLALNQEQDATTLIVEWNDFSKQSSFTMVYRIRARELIFEIYA